MEPNYPSSQPPYVRAEVVDSPRPVPRRRSNLLTGCLLPLLILGLGGSLLVNAILLVAFPGFDGSTRVQERHFSHNRHAKSKIAIISVEGTILEGRGFAKRQIEHARKDDDVKAVVLRVNSPGGTVTGADGIYHELSRLVSQRGIPLVVSMGGIAASGGYYVSMAVGPRTDSIFAEPTTWTGSIGVVMPHFNVAQLMEEWGVKSDSVVSKPLKGMGSFTRPMSEEERRLFQALVDDAFAGFKEVIRSGRPKFKADPGALERVTTGQVFTAKQALENGLVDKIGYVEDAVDQAIQFAGLSPDEVHVVQYRPEFSLTDVFLDSASDGSAKSRGLTLDAIVELTVPRAYYLCTWLPPLLSTAK
jgi:protease-4